MKWQLLLISSLLAGCASHQPAPPLPKPVTITEYVVPDCGNPPTRSPVEFRSVTWRVIQTPESDWFALSPAEYADLGFNTSETIKGARELRAENQYFRNCLKRERQAAEAKNAARRNDH